jgi:hypothetical protein
MCPRRGSERITDGFCCAHTTTVQLGSIEIHTYHDLLCIVICVEYYHVENIHWGGIYSQFKFETAKKLILIVKGFLIKRLQSTYTLETKQSAIFYLAGYPEQYSI